MPPKKLLSQIDEIVSQIPVISEKKSYWLIRTQSGKLYDAFRKHGFVAIEHEEVSLSTFYSLRQKHGSNSTVLQSELKKILIPFQSKDKNKTEKERSAAIAAGQITKFMFEVKKGDIVVIPSENSYTISFGEVISTAVPELTDAQIAKSECTYKKRKKVKWIQDINRDKLDPLLYKGFQAHQAINNWNSYGEYVERTISNFFVTKEDANVILEVTARGEINAKDVFKMGLNILEVTDAFFKENGIALSTNNVDLKINLNSPGKIQFKAPDTKTIWMIAVIGTFLIGGGLKLNIPNQFSLDLSTDGVIKKVIDYQNNAHDREKMDELIKQMDTLKVLPPDDALKMIKQMSTNKDLPR